KRCGKHRERTDRPDEILRTLGHKGDPIIYATDVQKVELNSVQNRVSAAQKPIDFRNILWHKVSNARNVIDIHCASLPARTSL
ncbi:MAG TPA: hypothetical protein VM680_14060, partial [Verrucomicrobiae bacterium]|nr:hypothetical protein [Verrucomicrobiae bacterium]